MKTVILIGAGATLGEALPSQPSRDERPPLDTTFFALCRLAKLEGRSVIQRYMTQHYGIDPFTSGCRMEEIFNYVYSDAFAATPSDESLRAFWVLLQMYRAAIARTTNSLRGISRYGVGALLRFLWRNDSTRDLIFITFNQDLVIEKAINAAVSTGRYSKIPWNMDSTYHVVFKNTLTNNAKPRPFVQNGPVSVPILKLHGSFNWVYPVRSGTDPKNSIRDPKAGLRRLDDQWIPVGRFNISRSAGRSRRNDLISFIVPPIYEKSSRFQKILQPIWDKARRALETCDELVIFGYSFPDADFPARSMLRRSYHQNTKLRDVHIIDTNPAVSSKIASLLEASSVYYCRTVPDFIRHYE